MMKIGIINYGAGNTKSVHFALNRLNCITIVSSNSNELENCDKIIFPGVGHAKPAMNLLVKAELNHFIKNTKKPLLGICLGMQLLCRFTEEGATNCLGVIDDDVLFFDKKYGVKVPHMGWNTVLPKETSKLFIGIEPNAYFYFVHSYYVPLNNNTDSICEYGLKFTASLVKDNFFGVQFHPEKSGVQGMKLLENFVKL